MDRLILIGIGYLLFFIMIILLIISRKKRYAKDKRGKRIHKVTKVFFWIIFAILSPILIRVGITYAFLLLIVPGFINLFFNSGGSGSTYSTYYSGNNNKNRSGTSTSDHKKTYCYYKDGKTSTIYDNDTVIRNDGVVGFKTGDYIHYNDGTTGHIVKLDNNKGIIEK